MRPYQYHLVLSFCFLFLFHASAATLYVSLNSTNPIPPYTNWATAATAIQDAIKVSTNGDHVLVADGTYAGSRTNVGGGATRVFINQAVTVQSVNGPAVTTIRGQALNPAVRCVYLVSGATLSGFTLTAGNGVLAAGGAECQSSLCILTNCIVTGNTEAGAGSGVPSSGGVAGGTLYNCTISGNTGTEFGGVYGSTLYNCTISGNSAPGNGKYSGYGGGVANCVCYGCTLNGNSAEFVGGGADESTLNNCLIIGNTCNDGGGGALACTLINCTIVGNTVNNYLDDGGGTEFCEITNCIVYYNYPNNYDSQSSMNCCSTPLLSGLNNFTNAPVFANPAGGDYRLQSNSPCINSGNNTYVSSATDLDGSPRIIGGTVDMGAYEYQSPTSVLSYAWLQQYGLPTDGSVDYADLDGTGFNVYQDWVAGLNPTNALSVLKMTTATPTNNPSGSVVIWQSVNNITYFLQISTNLAAQPAFSTIQSNIVGQMDTTSYTDTNTIGKGPFFYRVGVQQ